MKEWTAHTDTDTSSTPEFIVVPKTTQQAMQGKCTRIMKKVLSREKEDEDGQTANGSSSTEVGPSNNSGEKGITTNNFYKPTVLTDHGGDLFQHVNAKLHQLDIQDVNSDLIQPQKWYSELRHRTLVMVRATMYTFNWKEQWVYQLNAHTICILDESKLDIKPLSPQLNGFNLEALHSKLHASNAMAGVQLGKRTREE
ncbi:uncharacterized protein BJ212DRAFT_1301275 [Suillus subaureus]|uniref:Uncharacterized protein n=1 Tax=Suillus subaureus TaxID=48587 RepID=A0A9P7JB42_9AGAM|nr:uncharacterized protein BJ212DRAFT_1301275 [Suillus subaureus]KAG1812783.1 hypothetical protein BJ212DRAFT_1301275 [Suillus subaureus]